MVAISFKMNLEHIIYRNQQYRSCWYEKSQIKVHRESDRIPAQNETLPGADRLCNTPNWSLRLHRFQPQITTFHIILKN